MGKEAGKKQHLEACETCQLAQHLRFAPAGLLRPTRRRKLRRRSASRTSRQRSSVMTRRFRTSRMASM